MLLCGGAKRERQRLQLDLIGSTDPYLILPLFSVPCNLAAGLGHSRRDDREAPARSPPPAAVRPHGPRVQGG